MKLSSGITLLLLALFVWQAYQGNMFMVIHTWDNSTWAMMALGILAGWSLRNEFGAL